MAIMMAKFGPPLQTLRSYAVLAVLSMLMLPKLLRVPMTLGVAYPLDFPAWSLIVEIFANVFHGLVLRRRSDRFLAGVVIVSALLFLGAVKVAGNAGFGASAREVPLAFTRILFSYTLGMLLFRYWQRGKFRFKIPFVLSPILLTFALMTPWCNGHVVRYDLLVIFFFFPALLTVSASSPPPARLKKVSQLLGRTSYAIYVLHIPFRDAEEIAAQHLGKHHIFLSSWETQLILLAGAIAMALLADRYYDEPVRAFLRQRFTPSRSLKPVPAIH
jgi:peptidoglycan/LPS O-acetylase OafA/YrhL